jgi:VWFA-related protein
MARPFVALVLPLLLSTTVSRAQQAVFSAKVESIRVDVLVTDNGQPIRGLGPSDFDVLDNGVPQAVDLVSFEQIPLNVILALDMSSSVAGERLDNLRAAGRAVLGGLNKEDQGGLVTFSHVVLLGHGLTHDVAPLRGALDQSEGSGNTALMDGSYAAMMLGESDAGRSLLIVFSDGLDTSSWLSAAAVLDTAKRSDIVVYGVATQSSAKPEFLRDLTVFTGGRFFEVEKTANLGQIFLSVLEEFRHRYLVSYTPRGVSKDGWHRLDVRLKNRKATIKSRLGYLAGSS